ncbi:MAG: hypothetical protein V9F05_19825 [Chitinophagaceae bacterium]|jgi:hypothetical protein|nr:hypothetical protein [Bacteroidota bacterium]MBP9881601.1 hypothetical protein [Chitinophagales bacterium]
MELTHYFQPGEIAPGEGAWVFLMRSPISPDVSIAEQITQFYSNAYMASCNDELAQMYGFDSKNDLVGAPVSTFMPASNSILELLETMIKSNYKLSGAISKEHAKDGRPIFFRNNMEAIFKDGLLIGGKGTQILVEKP